MVRECSVRKNGSIYFGKIWKYVNLGHPPSIFPTEKSREDLGNSLLASPATKFLQFLESRQLFDGFITRHLFGLFLNLMFSFG